MSERQNAKYTTNTIQNKVLQCLTDMLVTQIIFNVKERDKFSIMADETKVIKKKEKLSLVVRHYYNGAIHESFQHFLEAGRSNLEGFAEKKNSVLGKMWHGIQTIRTRLKI